MIDMHSRGCCVMLCFIHSIRFIFSFCLLVYLPVLLHDALNTCNSAPAAFVCLRRANVVVHRWINVTESSPTVLTEPGTAEFDFCFVFVQRSSMETSGITTLKNVYPCRLIGNNLKMSRLSVSSGCE